MSPGMLFEHCTPLAFTFARLKLQGAHTPTLFTSWTTISCSIQLFVYRSFNLCPPNLIAPGSKEDLNEAELLYFMQGGGLAPAETAFAALVRKVVITDEQAKSAHVLMASLPAFNVCTFLCDGFHSFFYYSSFAFLGVDYLMRV